MGQDSSAWLTRSQLNVNIFLSFCVTPTEMRLRNMPSSLTGNLSRRRKLEQTPLGTRVPSVLWNPQAKTVTCCPCLKPAGKRGKFRHCLHMNSSHQRLDNFACLSLDSCDKLWAGPWAESLRRECLCQCACYCAVGKPGLNAAKLQSKLLFGLLRLCWVAANTDFFWL